MPSFRSVLSCYIRRDVSQPEGQYLSILISTSGGNSALLASFVYTVHWYLSILISTSDLSLVQLITKQICLGSNYLVGEKGCCFWHCHWTLTSMSTPCSLLREIRHVWSVGMGTSASSTHRVWKHTWRFVTYDFEPEGSCIKLCYSFVVN